MGKKKSAAKGDVPYSIHPVVAYAQTIIRNMKERTGKSIEEWATLCRRQKPQDEKSCRAYLKREHGLGGTTASMIADRVFGKGAENVDPDAYLIAAAEYVEEMYSGGKSGLRPIHDRLLKMGRTLGTDVKVSPCKTIVPLYRNHVFAEIKPATRSRLDLGLALKGCQRKIPKRLIDTGGLAKGDRITHRIPLESEQEIDDQVSQWLKIAYDLDD